MKYKLILIVAILFSSCAGSNKEKKTERNKSDTNLNLDGIKELIFAQQNIFEVNEIIFDSINSKESIWKDFADIEAKIKNNDKPNAIQTLLNLLKIDSIESRQKLWIWNQLRELNHKNNQEVVLGLVLEVPQQGEIEYLAIYDDYKSRYINYTGKIGIWEVTDDLEMNNIVDKIITQSKEYLEYNELPIGRNKDLTNEVRFSFLTNQGIKQVTRSFQELDDPSNKIGNLFALSSQVLMRIIEEMYK